MYYANCEWYVDMGEYNKPLCERKSLRPAKCSECPVYIRSIESENAKLRELVKALHECTAKTIPVKRCAECDLFDGEDGCLDLVRMRELGIEVEDA